MGLKSLLTLFAAGVVHCHTTEHTTSLPASKCSPDVLALPAIEGIQILSAEAHSVKNYTFVDPLLANATAPDYFDFCNVTFIYAHPGWNDSVQLTTYLPEEGWNGRFLALGGGGMAAGGEPLIHLYFTLVTPLMRQKFAISTTDGGHPGSLEEAVNVDPDWVFTSPGNVDLPMLFNFASLSLHDMAVLGKMLVEKAYGHMPEYSYFFGSSTGGMQGHSLAQRYPLDFNGIVAYKPVVNWVKSFFSNEVAKLTMDMAGKYATPCELNVLSALALAACDELDGVKDGIISRPSLCTFDPRPLAGRAFDCNGVPSTFSNISTQVAHAVYTGPTSPSGEFRWYGFNKDVPLHAEGTGPAALICPETGGTCSAASFHMSDLWLRYFYAKNASLNLKDLTLEQSDDLFLAAVNEYESIIGTADPDLSRFRKAGGKMINWHGLQDQLVPVNGSTDYYDKVLAKDPKAQDFYRLFLAPGADHGGAGIAVSDEDSLNYLMNWVENGAANETLQAAGKTGLGVPAKRNLCMYPRVQHYVTGDPSLPSSFICV
ncbi:tannase and feruloyl esterase [Amniculicola lignicola CBS 123094]|uniref:Carboxylic ester hydrolase n=1 Tax=Amniculicola lignicola CBS 123094 TaxID=1392246 RepID=A0A6A5WY58_9PLEO|nr:tannase and feruloyl esterase [Amniculicola lignicola CBS 123094]